MQLGIINLTETPVSFTDKLVDQNFEVIVYGEQRPDAANVRYSKTLKHFAEILQAKRVVLVLSKDIHKTREVLETLKWFLSVSDVIMLEDETATPALRDIAGELVSIQIDLLSISSAERTHVYGNRFAFNYCESMLNLLFEGKYEYGGVIR
jgi:6-phosphogluconate dehydrogenase (decarboxylating)